MPECSCKDCAFRGMELCEHRKNLSKIRDLKAKVDNLYNALKPVLEVDCSSHMFGRILVAVETSQRIYHDGDDSVNTKGDSVNGKVDFGDIEWELSTVKKENGNENA